MVGPPGADVTDGAGADSLSVAEPDTAAGVDGSPFAVLVSMNASTSASVFSDASSDGETSGSPGTVSRSAERISTRLMESIPRPDSSSSVGSSISTG